MGNNEELLMVTKQGMVVRVPTDDIKAIGRLTSGVKGLSLKENDEVINVIPIVDKTKDLVITTNAGKGKRLELSSFIVQNRGGLGVSCIKLDQGDWVSGAALTSSCICRSSMDLPCAFAKLSKFCLRVCHVHCAIP